MTCPTCGADEPEAMHNVLGHKPITPHRDQCPPGSVGIPYAMEIEGSDRPQTVWVVCPRAVSRSS